MSRNKNGLTDIFERLMESLNDMAFDARQEINKELKNDAKIEKQLQSLTEALLPGADIFHLEDEEYEELEQNKEWLDLYETWQFYDEMHDVAKKVQGIIESASYKIERLG